MCEKAQEIQEKWKPKKGDFYTVVVHGKATDITDVYVDGFPSLPQRFIPLSELYVWLPRQDQLHETVGLDAIDGSIKVGEWGNCQVCDFNSYEQLWLGFVMKKKYNKTWNGKGWGKKHLTNELECV